MKEAAIKPIADIVLNHKANGDHKERFFVIKMNPENRKEALTEPYEIEGWTGFDFPIEMVAIMILNGIGIISQGLIMMPRTMKLAFT